MVAASLKGCSHSTLATTICLSQLMGCMRFSVIVTVGTMMFWMIKECSHGPIATVTAISLSQ